MGQQFIGIMSAQPIDRRDTVKVGDKIQGGPWDGFEVISTYSDAQALEDGDLIDVGHLTGDRRNRATAKIWHELTEQLSGKGIIDVTRFRQAWAKLAALEPIDGWRTDGDTWLIPNEVGGLTLMYASDY